MKNFIGYPILHCVIRVVEIPNHIRLSVGKNPYMSPRTPLYDESSRNSKS